MWEGNKYISMITFEPNFASIPKKKWPKYFHLLL